MTTRVFVILSAVLTMVAAGVTVQLPVASAQGCPDVSVVFARGTAEPGGPVGVTGTSFVAALQTQLGARSLRVYGVNYPASADFQNRLAFAQTVVDGIDDTQREVTSTAAACPRTRIVLGGYSQGAAVVGYAAGDSISVKQQYRRFAADIPGPLARDVRGHIAAMVLFAPPSHRFLDDAGAPDLTVDPALVPRTVRFCIPGDTVCDGAPLQQPNGLHVLYAVDGDTLSAARFAVSRI